MDKDKTLNDFADRLPDGPTRDWVKHSANLPVYPAPPMQDPATGEFLEPAPPAPTQEPPVVPCALLDRVPSEQRADLLSCFLKDAIMNCAEPVGVSGLPRVETQIYSILLQDRTTGGMSQEERRIMENWLVVVTENPKEGHALSLLVKSALYKVLATLPIPTAGEAPYFLSRN